MILLRFLCSIRSAAAFSIHCTLFTRTVARVDTAFIRLAVRKCVFLISRSACPHLKRFYHELFIHGGFMIQWVIVLLALLLWPCLRLFGSARMYGERRSDLEIHEFNLASHTAENNGDKEVFGYWAVPGEDSYQFIPYSPPIPFITRLRGCYSGNIKLLQVIHIYVSRTRGSVLHFSSGFSGPNISKVGFHYTTESCSNSLIDEDYLRKTGTIRSKYLFPWSALVLVVAWRKCVDNVLNSSFNNARSRLLDKVAKHYTGTEVI